ncbi:hypothetical protein K9M41_02435 [Candidatus Gracilibacteria bacterium]|nr:hypothetical protein [Candidatus Gracilibacteria bacterium]
MRYAEVIHNAWELTTSSTKLKWFCFVASFAAVVVFIFEIAWQLGMLSAEFGIVEHEFVYKTLGTSLSFLTSHHLLGWALFLLVFILLFEFVLQPWIQATLILAIRQEFNYPEKKLSLRQKIIEGGAYFFKLFEFRALFSPFALMTITLFTVTMYRYYHGDIFSEIVLPVVVPYLIISFFINVFLSFVPYFLVCEKCALGKSIRKSIGLVFLNFGVTMAIILLMFLVNFRIVINVLVVIGVPVGILGAATFFAQSSWLGFMVTLAIIIGVIMVALASYLTAIIEVFSTAVWERAFFRLRAKQIELSSEEEEPPLGIVDEEYI